MRPGAPGIVESWSRRGFVAAGLAGALPLSGCAGDVSFNYRVSVSVRRGGEPIVGSNVRRLRWHQGIKQLGFMDVSQWMTQGEATLVDLGSQGLLIATMAMRLFSPETSRWYVPSEIWTPAPAFTRAFGADVSTWPRQRNRPVALLPSEMPLLVTFRDPTDPHSLVEVPPEALSQVFGAGISLGQMTVEVTGSARTRHTVGPVLPWLRSLGEAPLPGSRVGSREIYDALAGYHFKTGN